MEIFSLLTAAVAPGVSLMAYFYLRDKYDAEPVKLVVRMFLFGLLLVFPTMVIQRGFVLGFGNNPLLLSFGISAGLEEFIKWFVLYFLIFSHSEFDEPYDGIVYSVAVALGFATLENIIYVFLNHSSFFSLLLRAFLPVSGHALFGVVMGYYLGKAKFAESKSKKRKMLLYSLLVPILWHGAFDYILLQSAKHWIWFIVPFMVLLWILGLRNVQIANLKSPYRQFSGGVD